MTQLEARQREVEYLHMFYEIEDENVLHLTKFIREVQERVKQGTGRYSSYTFLLLSLTAQHLARITVRTIVTHVLSGDHDAFPSYVFMAQSIRDRCCWELYAQEQEGKHLSDIVEQLSKRNENRNYSKRREELTQRVATWRSQDWRSREGGDTLGSLLIELATVAEIITIETEEQDSKDIRRVCLGRKFNLSLSSNERQLSNKSIAASTHVLVTRPMIVAPRPWEQLVGGGFLIASDKACPPEFAELVKHRNHDKRQQTLFEEAQRGKLTNVFNAVNALQSTSWCLNQRIYMVMRYAWENGMTGFPAIPDRELYQSLRGNLLSLSRQLRILEISDGRPLGKRRKELEEQRVVAALKARGSLTALDILKYYEKDPKKHQKDYLYLKDILLTMVTQQILEEVSEEAQSEGKLGSQPKKKVALYKLGSQPKKKVAFVEVDELKQQTLLLNDAWRGYYNKFNPLSDNISKSQRLLSQILRLETLLSVCEQLQQDSQLADGALRLYFPYQLDYRGRAYSMISLLNPQGNDHARALLKFADGKPLGTQGKFWLAVHVANMYGKDKESYQERFDWTIYHTSIIHMLVSLAQSDDTIGSVQLPIEAFNFWKEAKEPWQFLAACFEWVSCESENFQTHLPISLDASSSGYQHLSALAQDQEGARMTNLLPSDKPQDLYQRIANDLILAIKEEAHSGKEFDKGCAKAWSGHITRSTVKQAVMTTPYGSTFGGKRQQLIDYLNDLEDRGVTQDDRYLLFSHKRRNAIYLAKKLKNPVANVVPGALDVMKWLKDVTSFCAKQLGHGVFWTTPAGFPVIVEEYQTHKNKKTFTFTLDGKKEIREFELSFSDPTFGIDAQAQASKIVPNFIHSLDAAHMMLTICRLQKEGLQHFAVIHDSYGVHAPDIPIMMTALKEEFVKMYRISSKQPSRLKSFLEDQIKQLSYTIKAQDRTDEQLEESVNYKKLQAFIEKCPQDFQFDIEKILESEYMFS